MFFEWRKNSIRPFSAAKDQWARSWRPNSRWAAPLLCRSKLKSSLMLSILEKKNTGFLALFRILLVQNAVRGWRPPDRGRLVPFVLSCHHEGKMNSFSFYCRSVDITRTESRRVHSKSKTMTNNEITWPEVYWMALHGYIWFTEIRGGQTFWIADLVYMCYDVFFKSAEIDVRARKMCSLKLGSTENKKPKKMTTLEMIYDGCWIVLSCVWW